MQLDGIDSFIHCADLYCASSRLLLRSAPDPGTAKRNSFQDRVECVTMNPGEQSLRHWKSIPHGRANHQEYSSLPYRSTDKRDIEDPMKR